MWGSIYWENLRGYQDNACMEKRILFRLLSGLHSSIMTQIANQYRFDGKDQELRAVTALSLLRLAGACVVGLSKCSLRAGGVFWWTLRFGVPTYAAKFRRVAFGRSSRLSHGCGVANRGDRRALARHRSAS